MTANPNSIEARKVRLDRDLDLMKSELAHLDARAMKAEFDREEPRKRSVGRASAFLTARAPVTVGEPDGVDVWLASAPLTWANRSDCEER